MNAYKNKNKFYDFKPPSFKRIHTGLIGVSSLQIHIHVLVIFREFIIKHFIDTRYVFRNEKQTTSNSSPFVYVNIYDNGFENASSMNRSTSIVINIMMVSITFLR